MAEYKELTQRRRQSILTLVKLHPGISTREICDALQGEFGSSSLSRNIQRDLKYFRNMDSAPIEELKDSAKKGCSYEPTPHMPRDVGEMSSNSALAYWLAGEHLKPLLPESVVDEWQPLLDQAERKLDQIADSHRGVAGWRNKVRVFAAGPRRKRPEVDANIQKSVYQCLLIGRCLTITYRAAITPDELDVYEKVAPYGLIFRDGIAYLLCTIDGETNKVTLALHRMESAEQTAGTHPACVPMGFNLDDELASKRLMFSDGSTIQLEAIFSQKMAFHIGEHPLSEDQKMVSLEDGRQRVTATVESGGELEWWLLSLGDQVEVVGPEKLRERIVNTVRSMADIYGV